MPVREHDGTVIGGVEILCDATSAASSSKVHSAKSGKSPTATRSQAWRIGATLIGCSSVALKTSRVGQPFSLIMSDLDHFKQINDTWGHVIGDQAPVRFAAVLQNQCRPGDLVARFGGEEFIVLLPGHALETAIQIAERLGKAALTATPEILGAASSQPALE